MAATAHSDPYAIFLRKVGYSVGLERTLERVGDLDELYRQKLDVTTSSWKELVAGPEYWNLKSDNIGDVFYSLRFVHRTAGDVLVLENLDAMAIANTLTGDRSRQEAARSFLLLWAILVSDGEIFVNMLLSDFEEARIKKKLTAMLLQKRALVRKALKGRGSDRRINRIITIERQETNKGSAGGKQSVASLKRTEPLQPKRTTANERSQPEDIEFSEDYFRKVPPRRKDWARSLGLWDDALGLTKRGADFIDALSDTGYIGAEGLFIFWPMDYELVRAGFRPDLFGEKSKGIWQCLVDFGRAYAGLSVKPQSKHDADAAVALITAMMGVFRSLHARKAMLRRELPITIAYPAAIARACADQEPVLDLPAAIAAEQKGEERRLAFRQSRNTGGALSLKR